MDILYVLGVVGKRNYF